MFDRRIDLAGNLIGLGVHGIDLCFEIANGLFEERFVLRIGLHALAVAEHFLHVCRLMKNGCRDLGKGPGQRHVLFSDLREFDPDAPHRNYGITSSCEEKGADTAMISNVLVYTLRLDNSIATSTVEWAPAAAEFAYKGTTIWYECLPPYEN